MSTPVTPEVAHALELARKRYGQNFEAAPLPAHKRQFPEGHKVHPRQAFASGAKNKHDGMMRVSPYYSAEKSDHFWFSGYDGKTMEEAIGTQSSHELRMELALDAAIAESMEAIDRA